jgi:tetratricopeptide (TPR) repeat protein
MALAGLARERGDLRGEATVLKAAIEADPNDAAMRGALALCLAGLGERGAARAEALEATRLDPKTPGAQRLLAALAWDDRDYRGALERAVIALRIDAGDAVADRLLEGAFYVEVATRLGCEVGARPTSGWPADTVIRVLKGIEQEYGIEGAATFVDLEARFGADPDVATRVQEAVDARCPKGR